MGFFSWPRRKSPPTATKAEGTPKLQDPFRPTQDPRTTEDEDLQGMSAHIEAIDFCQCSCFLRHRRIPHIHARRISAVAFVVTTPCAQ